MHTVSWETTTVTESGGSPGPSSGGATPPDGKTEPQGDLPRWQPFADVPPRAPDEDTGTLVPEGLHDSPAYIPPAMGMTPGTVMPPDPADVPSSAWITTAPAATNPKTGTNRMTGIIGTIIGLVVLAFVAAGVLGFLPSDKGKVLFGTALGKDLCGVSNQSTTIKTADPVFFSAVLKHHMDGNQAISLRITRDGKDLVNYDEPADGTAFDCYGNRETLGPLDAGKYHFEVIHNGEIEASGDLTIT